MIRAVVMDLDGTLLDTLDDICTSVNLALAQFGYAARTREEIRSFVGNGAVKLLERALPHEVDAQTFEALYRTYDTLYTAHRQDTTRPYDGVVALLRELRRRGLRTAVLSNKQDNVVRPLCAHYFPDLLDAATGPTAQRRTKPAADGLLYLAQQLDVTLPQILYVGDSETDVLTGKNAGVRTVAALWGFRDRSALEAAGATLCAEKAEDILQFLE